MTISPSMLKNIEAILFDMNGTLRIREPHEPTQSKANERLVETLGKGDFSSVDWDELIRRQKAYSHWAQENLLQLSESEIWTQWILPDYPLAQIEPIAAELTLAWSERKGRTIPNPGARETLIELKHRGYHLGVISNTMSSLDIPHSLDSYGWNDFFEVVILSSTLKHRKPAPEPFLEAARVLKLEPSHCAYLGNRISRDVVGCKRAGFGLGIIIETPGKPRADETDRTVPPDAIIHSLSEILDIFPARR